MTQEEKELLFEDLCARLPYEPFAQWHHKALNEFRDVKIMKISTYGKNIDDYHINVLCQPEPGVDYEASIIDIKPYLRPLSSMTEEEEEEFNTIWEGGFSKALDLQIETDLKSIENFSFEGNYDNVRYLEIITAFNTIQWLLSKHFDLVGLIEKGLALEASEDMY